MSKVTKRELLRRIEALEEWSNGADDMLTELNHALPDPEYDAKCAENAVAVEESLARHAVRLGLVKPELKQLDQSVFDGLDEKWQWATMSSVGIPFVYSYKPAGNRAWFSDSTTQEMINAGKVMRIDEHGYDTTNWQNSLIERDKVELTGSDLCRAMLERGDKCVLIRMGVRDDRQAKDIGRFAIATSIDESGRFNVMSDQQPISKVDFVVPINNQGEPLTATDVGL